MSYSSSFIENRLIKLKKSLGKEALLIEDPIDLTYLTGLKLSAGKLLICSNEALLLVDPRYEETAKKAPCKAALLSFKEEQSFFERNKIKEVKFDGAKSSYEKGLALQKRDEQLFFVSSPHLTKELRLFKDPSEIMALQTSADLLVKGFAYIQTLLCEGISEKEISLEFTLFCLKQGASALSFEPIIAFGENSALPHYRAGERRLKQGDVILIDIGIISDHYHSDMTRMLFFGPKDPLFSKLFSYVIKAHEAALNLCKGGTPIKELDIAARAIFKQYGVEKYFLHSLGHGVGLEIHEFPKIRFDAAEGDLILKPGMVFTIEPGLYLKGRLGVRYEDTILITEEGYRNFTAQQNLDKSTQSHR